MTDETVDKLVAFKDKRANYTTFLQNLGWQIERKKITDANIRKSAEEGWGGYTGECFLKFFASIGLIKDRHTDKDMVRVTPHYEGCPGSYLEADEDLLILIQEWVQKKLTEIEAEMDQVAKGEAVAKDAESDSNG